MLLARRPRWRRRRRARRRPAIAVVAARPPRGRVDLGAVRVRRPVPAGPARRSPRRAPRPCTTGSTSRPRRPASSSPQPRAPSRCSMASWCSAHEAEARARPRRRRRSPRTRCGRRAGPRRSRPSASVGSASSATRLAASAACDLGVGPERRRPLLEQQVGAHVGRGRVPHAVDVLGARRLVVEVAGPVVGAAAVRPAVLEQVDQGERVDAGRRGRTPGPGRT